MAASIIGRKACPWCGFEHAHIKQTEGKQPYQHCPECGVMTHAKSGAQARLIVAGMKTTQAAPADPAPAASKPQAAPKQAPQADPPTQTSKPQAAPSAAPAAPADTKPSTRPASWLDTLGL